MHLHLENYSCREAIPKGSLAPTSEMWCYPDYNGIFADGVRCNLYLAITPSATIGGGHLQYTYNRQDPQPLIQYNRYARVGRQ